ncbi:MAG: EF-P beta-lysylation protein EpmB [Gammaproteobacteria bacterium]
MISKIPVFNSATAWQQSLKNGFRNVNELLRFLNLSVEQISPAPDPDANFPLRVPRSYAERITKGNAEDPLLLQILPVDIENNRIPGFVADPVGDHAALVGNGLVKKYAGRALLITTGACAIHCRYCFRRHFPYATANGNLDQWQSAIEFIRQDESISEVILSGGDPLLMENEYLSRLTNQLKPIPHIKRVRIHTRIPVVLPDRIDQAFIAWLSELPFNTSIVIHCNHANEIDALVGKTLLKLARTNATIFNQSVLLHRINDSVEALSSLSERLFESRVIPYYLHLLDKVQGAAHFDVSRDKALEIMHELRQRLPGYLTPRLVKEKAGAACKIPLFSTSDHYPEFE